jgi:hypothetical protein
MSLGCCQGSLSLKYRTIDYILIGFCHLSFLDGGAPHVSISLMITVKTITLDKLKLAEFV